MTALAAIPSPPFESLHIGALQLRAYGLMIGLGVMAAVSLGQRRWDRRGGAPGAIGSLAVWAVPAGLIGARMYHVFTNYEGYSGRPWRAFRIWDGGLGIPGGIAVGVVCGLIVARRRGMPLASLLDTVAPALPLAQAIGRWGNWFNQELFGRPTSLPWGVRIDPANRPASFASYSTFQPTFLYESLWNVALVGFLLLVERRLSLRPGRLFVVYLAGYALGRLWIERLRIDFAHIIGGLRVNEWMALLVLLGALVFFIVDAWRYRSRADDESRAPTPSVGQR